MRPTSIRLLMLAIAATTAMSVVTAADARHVRKHHAQYHHGFRNSLAAGEVGTVAPSISSGDVCPGNARAIDCKVFPPPIMDDPDRRGTGGDGM